MNDTEILKYMIDTGALLNGHFLLRSGLHSDQYFQAAQLLQNTRIATLLCTEMAKQWNADEIDVVLSPAIGGIVVGQEVGRALDKRAIFAEKDEESNLLLRRGFVLRPGERVLVAEESGWFAYETDGYESVISAEASAVCTAATAPPALYLLLCSVSLQ